MATTARSGPTADDRPAPRPVVNKRKGFSSYAEGELCTVEGCDTVLSMYNSSKVCANHDEAPS